MNVLVLLTVIISCWIAMTSAASVHHQNAAKTAQVYRILPVAKTDIFNNTQVEIDLSANLVKFPSGKCCKYSSGSCYDHLIHKWFHWKVKYALCPSLANVSYDDQLQTNSLVVFQNGSSFVALRLVKEEELCGRNLWRTNNSELVLEGIHLNTRRRKSGDSDPYHEDNNQENHRQGQLNVQHELRKLREENALLRRNIKVIQDQLELNSLELSRLSEIVEGLHSERHMTKRNAEPVPGSFLDSVCSNFLFFPCENILVVVVIISYLTFSVINVFMNYASLRMLRIKRDPSIIFYALNHGLTIRYVCRTLGLNKRKVDKWLLDIETPLK